MGMALTCNISRAGRRLRLWSGVALILVSVGFAGWTAVNRPGELWPWVAVIAALAMGAFQVFEGVCGWCVVRAMGFRTPI
jgi:hypothetical protein